MLKKKKEEAKFKDISKVLDMCPTENKERLFMLVWGLPQWLSSKETTCNAGDTSSIPGLGRSPGRGLLEHPLGRPWVPKRACVPSPPAPVTPPDTHLPACEGHSTAHPLGSWRLCGNIGVRASPALPRAVCSLLGEKGITL